MYTHIFSIQKYIDTSNLNYDIVKYLNDAIPRRLLDVIFSHCMSNYLFFQYPAYLEMYGYIKDIIILPKDTIIYRGSNVSDLEFRYPASFTTHKEIAQYFGNNVVSTTLSNKKYIYLSPELSYVLFCLYKGFSRAPCQYEVVMLSKISKEEYTIEVFEDYSVPKDYMYSKDEISYPCMCFGMSRYINVNNKYICIIKYQQYTKLLTHMLNHFDIRRNTIPNETIYLFNKNTSIWKKIVTHVYKLFDKNVDYDYQFFMSNINDTNKLIFRFNISILKILMYLVRTIFELLKCNLEDDLSNSIVIINKELFYLIRYVFLDLNENIKKDIAEKVLNSKIQFSLDKLHMFCVGNTNDNDLHFCKTIKELGYKNIEDIFNTIKEYVFIHVRYGSIYTEVSYVHISVSLLLHAIVDIMYPYLDHKTYNYIEKLHLNLL